MALLDNGSPQTFIRPNVLDRMLSVGAASVACERKCAPRSWGGFGESTPLQTSTSVRLRVQFFRADEPTCSLAVWDCVIPPSVMQHAVLRGRDSWMRLNNRSYRSPLPLPSDHRILASSSCLTKPRQACGLRRKPRGFVWRLPPSLRGRRRHHSIQRTTIACSELGSQQ